MKINIGVSARHIHLSKEDFELLFPNEELNVYKELSQYPNYASDKKVILKNGDKAIENVRVIGPLRDETQVELSKTDCYTLKIDAPLCNSGELDNAAVLEIVNGDKSVVRKCAIIQNRHIHISFEDAEKYGFTNNQKVKVHINSRKSGTIEDVYIKTGEKFSLELQLDTDDANAFLIDENSEAEII